MAETVRSDFEGTVLARNSIGDFQVLEAGDTIPSGYWIGGAFVQGGDPDDVTPPWSTPAEVTVTSAQITDATDVGVALLTAVDEAAGRAAIGAAKDGA